MVESELAVRVTVGSGGGIDVLAAARKVAAIPITEVGPTGIVGLEPLVLTTRKGTTTFHAACTPSEAEAIVSTVEEGDLPAEDAYAVVEHPPSVDGLPIPSDSPFAVGRRRALGRCGWVDPSALPHDRVSDCSDAAVRMVERSGLLGRGRGDAAADERVAPRWMHAREAAGDPVVVVNGHESDPAAAMDRTLLEGVPAEVLDAAAAVAHAIRAEAVVVYLREGDDLARARVEAAAATLTGVNDLQVEVVTGPDEFRAGEVTMALEAMEGADRLEARLRPPGPAEHGLYGRPTVIHTPRTLAQLREAVLHGVDPDAADPGTRVLTVTGDVDASATVELPTDSALRVALSAVGDPQFKMACVGGRFGGLVDGLGVPASAPALAGATLGTEGVVELLSDSRCAVATAGHRARFAREANCGRCIPCREGSKQLHELLREVYDGHYHDGKLRELGQVVRATSVCSFGRAAARPVLTAMETFEAEFRAHADGRCPAGECNTQQPGAES